MLRIDKPQSEREEDQTKNLHKIVIAKKHGLKDFVISIFSFHSRFAAILFLELTVRMGIT